MSELDDRDVLAAEYVLGTLTREEREAVAIQRRTDRTLERAIEAWEQRLGPMIATVKPVQPDPSVFERVREQIEITSNIIAFKGRETALRETSRRWRSTAVGFGAIAATLIGVIAWREAARPVIPSTYVAVLQADKTSPAFLMTVDTKTQMFAVRALATPAETGKSYELWLVNDKLEKPMSLGTLEGDRSVDRSQIDQGLFMDATFAVSLEPRGGSPTGAPTGPVLFSGKLYKSMP